MATITVSNQIAAPVAAVFERFTDLEGSPARVSGIKSIEILTTGRFGPMTRWRETREVLGRLDTADMEVTAFERDRTIERDLVGAARHLVGAGADHHPRAAA